MSPEVLVVGSYVQDHAWTVDRFPVPGETRRAGGFAAGPGGKGFNQAVACQRMGARTLFLGALGRDALADTAKRYAADEGLACRWLQTDEAPTAASSIVVDGEGQNQIAVFLGANERLSMRFLDDAAQEFKAASFLLVQLENNLDAIGHALALARRAGCTCVLNPAPVHPRLDAGLLARCDLITPNETELALLLEKITDVRIAPERIAGLSDDALHAYCRRLAVATVVVTLGQQGCFVSHGEDAPLGRSEPRRYRIVPETVQVRDTTGAGDAFSGALVAAMVRLGPNRFRDAIELANAAAALSTEGLGTAPAMPRLRDVERRFPKRMG